MYFLLISFGFVFIYPLIYMVGYSFMSQGDLRSALVTYLPTAIDTSNYATAASVLNFWPSLLNTLYVAVLPAICQTAVACITAYGLSNYRFPGRRIVFALVVATIIIPPTITMLPQFLIYKSLGLTDTLFAFAIPAVLGQGLRAAIIILVFYQIFNMIPRSLYDAARIDGAGPVKLFIRIGVPLAKAGFVIGFLFSLIWYWNETTLAAMYMGNKISTMPMQLETFAQNFSHHYSARSGKSLNEAVYMAGTLLSILPLIVFYFFTQRQFVQSVDKAGITGE